MCLRHRVRPPEARGGAHGEEDLQARDLIYQALDERYGDEDQTEINELLAWLAELDAARAERAERIKADEARIRRLVNGRRQAAVKLLNQVAQWKKVLQDIRKNDIESAAYHLQVGERDAAKEDMARVGRTEQEIQGVDTLEYRLNHFLRQDSLGVR